MKGIDCRSSSTFSCTKVCSNLSMGQGYYVPDESKAAQVSESVFRLHTQCAALFRFKTVHGHVERRGSVNAGVVGNSGCRGLHAHRCQEFQSLI
jgi:hypothetical protein